MGDIVFREVKLYSVDVFDGLDSDSYPAREIGDAAVRIAGEPGTSTGLDSVIRSAAHLGARMAIASVRTAVSHGELLNNENFMFSTGVPAVQRVVDHTLADVQHGSEADSA